MSIHETKIKNIHSCWVILITCGYFYFWIQSFYSQFICACCRDWPGFQVKLILCIFNTKCFRNFAALMTIIWALLGFSCDNTCDVMFYERTILYLYSINSIFTKSFWFTSYSNLRFFMIVVGLKLSCYFQT